MSRQSNLGGKTTWIEIDKPMEHFRPMGGKRGPDLMVRAQSDGDVEVDIFTGQGHLSPSIGFRTHRVTVALSKAEATMLRDALDLVLS